MELITKKICMAKDIGIHNNLFGGILMAWIDEAAAAFATEYCHTPFMVTLKVGELIFKKPVKVGNHLHIYGDVISMGRTSLTINIEARKFNLYSGEEIPVCTTTMTFVRIDEDGTPTPIAENIRRKHQDAQKLKKEKHIELEILKEYN